MYLTITIKRHKTIEPMNVTCPISLESYGQFTVRLQSKISSNKRSYRQLFEKEYTGLSF